MKATVTQEQFDALDSAFQGEYKKDGDDYQLTVDGGEDTGALKRAKDHEKAARQKAELSLTETKKKLTEKEDELIDIRKGVIPKSDMDALEKSWQEKIDNQKTDYESKLGESENSLKAVLVDNVANKLAGEISTIPHLMAQEIKSRLTTEMVDGRRVTRVLDSNGKPSALTIDELKKEIVANEKFAPIIVGSKASGSGANGGGSNGSAKTFKDMSEGDRVKLYRENKDQYVKLRDAERASA